MDLSPFIYTSFDSIQTEVNLSSSTTPTYIYCRPHPRVITGFAKQARQKSMDTGTMTEVVQPQGMYEHQEGESMRCRRTHFTVFQRDELEKTFNQSQYISPWKRQSLSQQLGIPKEVILTWFKNRRAKWRKQQRKTGARTAGCCVPTGPHLHYFSHVPYPNRKLMMKDARMLYENAAAHALDDEESNMSAWDY